MRLSEQQSDFLWMEWRLLGFAHKIFFEQSHEMEGYYLKRTSLYRTPEEQKKLVDEGFSWTLNSKHLSGLAVDYMIIKSQECIYEHAVYGMMGTYWENIGGTWGGNWKGKKRDIFHFEYNLKKRQVFLKEDAKDPFSY